MFTRQSVPWWECSDICADVARARNEAGGMETALRVQAFGQPTLRELFSTLERLEMSCEHLGIDTVAFHARRGHGLAGVIRVAEIL